MVLLPSEDLHLGMGIEMDVDEEDQMVDHLGMASMMVVVGMVLTLKEKKKRKKSVGENG